MAKLIARAMPLTEIQRACRREKSGRGTAGAKLHLWWGRSPEAATLAALAAALTESAAEDPEEELRPVAALAKGEDGALEAMRARPGTELPAVWDAFCGSGGIPLAAQKLGMRSFANELNPVAALLTRAAADIPARFAGRNAVHPGARPGISQQGASGLAEDVRCYGERMLEQAGERLAGLYPALPDGSEPLAWIWVRTMQCPNPVCRCTMPLAGSYLLQNRGKEQVWAEPEYGAGELKFTIREGVCPPGQESNKVGSSGAKFRCPLCGTVTTEEEVRKRGQAGEPGVQLMAVVAQVKGKRVFLAPDEAQCAAAAVPRPEDAPNGKLPAQSRCYLPAAYGCTEFAELFTPRELTMLCCFSDLVQEAEDRAASDALAADMEAEGGNLEDGGSGALAYGQAVGLYLALAVDKLVNYHSMLCSWNAPRQTLRASFGRRTLPMVWTFAEGNPFAQMAGSFRAMVARVADSLAQLPAVLPATVTQDNAVTMEHPRDVLVCTELPHYGDIAYAEPADFFYIWLRRSLKRSWPKTFAMPASPREELTAAAGSSLSAEEAEERYREELRAVCRKLCAGSRADVPALLFYRFSRKDRESIAQGGDACKLSAWEFMLQSLLEAGFAIDAVWPMRPEPAAGTEEAARVLIVADKGVQRSEQIPRQAFLRALKRELPGKAREAKLEGLAAEDREIAWMGLGLSIYTRYAHIVNADGSTMGIREALKAIADKYEFMEPTNTLP